MKKKMKKEEVIEKLVEIGFVANALDSNHVARLHDWFSIKFIFVGGKDVMVFMNMEKDFKNRFIATELLPSSDYEFNVQMAKKGIISYHDNEPGRVKTSDVLIKMLMEHGFKTQGRENLFINRNSNYSVKHSIANNGKHIMTIMDLSKEKWKSFIAVEEIPYTAEEFYIQFGKKNVI
jgi:hypothetical protein